MDTVEALDLLMLDDGADAEDVRAAYHREIRLHHPDVAGTSEDSHRITIALVEAHEVLLDELEHSPTGTLARPEPPAGAPADGPGPDATAPRPATREPGWAASAIHVHAFDEGSLTIEAPPDEAFAELYEAASLVGDVSFIDRQLAILEIIVRFEGGPSCSVVMTLQGRNDGTEVFCSMESIEAAPAPPITPVIDALVAALRGELVAPDEAV